MAPFFSSLSFGGMARARGLGGVRRSLVANFVLTFSHNGAQITYGDTLTTTSETRFVASGDSGGQANVRVQIDGNNGRSTGTILMTVGQDFTWLAESSNSQAWSSLITGNFVGQSTSSYGPRIVMLAASRARTACYSGGSAGFPQGSQGSGNGQAPGTQFGWGGNGGGGSGGRTNGYLSGSGGQGGAYYNGPGATPGNGGFLSGGSGGQPWFQGQNSPGGVGYYGGGGGGGGWAPGRGQGCPGGGGGGSNYVGGLPSSAPGGPVQIFSTSSGTGGSNATFRILSIEPI